MDNDDCRLLSTFVKEVEDMAAINVRAFAESWVRQDPNALVGIPPEEKQEFLEILKGMVLALDAVHEDDIMAVGADLGERFKKAKSEAARKSRELYAAYAFFADEPDDFSGIEFLPPPP